MDEDDDINKFTAFLEEFSLYDAIDQKNYKRFRHLICQDNFEINQIDRYGRSILLQLANISRCEKFAAELLQNGADPHLTDSWGYSFLHLAARNKKVNNLKTVQLILSRGVDVNCQDESGLTPLYTACLEGNINLIYLFLYYEADPNIASNQGLLPVSVLSSHHCSQKQHNQLLDILCLYTFADTDPCISMSTLASAMWRNSPFFNKIVEYAPKIICDQKSIDYFCWYFSDIKYKHFVVFGQKFPDVFLILMENVDLLHVVLDSSGSLMEASLILDYLLESEHAITLIQNSEPEHSIISKYINVLISKISKEEIQKKIFFMLSYGLGVTAGDLETVFKFFGYCELFKLLLHMDILPMGEDNLRPIVRLCYNPNLSFGDIWDDNVDMFDLLGYFNSPKLKELCLSNSDDVPLVKRVRMMPHISTLVELCRDVARKYIMAKYNVRSCKEFYSALNGLRIDVYSKRILALERQLH